MQPGSDSLLGQTPGVFKGVISYSIALQKQGYLPQRLADENPWGLKLTPMVAQ
jgi:hypothetical protein